MFFHAHVHEGYYENNVNRCFTNLSGYKDNGTVRTCPLAVHLKDKVMPFILMVKIKQHCLVVGARIMRTWKM